MPLQCTDFKHKGCWIKLALGQVSGIIIRKTPNRIKSPFVPLGANSRKPQWEDQSAWMALTPQDSTFNFRCKALPSLASNTVQLSFSRWGFHLPSAPWKQPAFLLPSVSCRKITFVPTDLSAWTTAEFLLEFSFLVGTCQHSESLVKMKSANKKGGVLWSYHCSSSSCASYSSLSQKCVTLRFLNICHTFTAAGITRNQLSSAKGGESGRESASRAQTKHCPAPSQPHQGANPALGQWGVTGHCSAPPTARAFPECWHTEHQSVCAVRAQGI